MPFRPLHDQIVVRPVDADTKSSGGIILPDTAKEKPVEGIIEAVGSGFRDKQGALVSLGVKEGDRVLFGKWSGTEVQVDGEALLILKEADILGVLGIASAADAGGVSGAEDQAQAATEGSLPGERGTRSGGPGDDD